MPIKRRHLLSGFAQALTAGLGTAGVYGVTEATTRNLHIEEYDVSVPTWPLNFNLTVTMISDLHIANPFMGLDALINVVNTANALQSDMIVLLGDYVTASGYITTLVPERDWAMVLSQLRAPLGVVAIEGNHDWKYGIGLVRRAFNQARIPLLENNAVRREKDGQPFWVAGLGSWLGRPLADGTRESRAHVTATLARISDNAPALLLAHEPQAARDLPARFPVTLCGHTHGGQINLFGYRPVLEAISGAPDRVRGVYDEDDGRKTIITSGIGHSGLPIRIGTPPELVRLRLSGPRTLGRVYRV